MRFKIFLAVAIIIVCSFSPLFAVASDSGSSYGKWAHAFFSGEYEKALTQLSEAVDAKTIDPRVYFFRGLALKRMDRAEAAQKDFQEGARLEVSKSNYFFDVNSALTRVQGKERLLIEQARSVARVESQKASKKRAATRYEVARIQEGRVLRRNLPLNEAVSFARVNSPDTTANKFQVSTPKASTEAPPGASTGSPTEASKGIRLDRLFKAFGSSVGQAVQGSVIGGMMPMPMGMPGEGGPGQFDQPGPGMPIPTQGDDNPFGDDEPFDEPNIQPPSSSEPDTSAPSFPEPDQKDNPFSSSLETPEPAPEFANSEARPVHESPQPETLVVVFPTNQKLKPLAADPAPSFEMTEPIVEIPQVKLTMRSVTSLPAMSEPLEQEPMPEVPTVEEPTIEEPTVEELAIEEPTVEVPTIEVPAVEELAIEEPTVEVPTIEVPAINSEDDPFANPGSKEPKQTMPKRALEDKPAKPIAKSVPQSSDVRKTPVTEKPVTEKRVAPNETERKPIPPGASALPSIDLNNLAPEDDPFA